MEEGWEDLSEEKNGGCLKRMIAAGNGERPSLDGKMKVVVKLTGSYVDKKTGKTKIFEKPTEAVPEQDWLLYKDMTKPCRGLNIVVGTMTKGEKCICKLTPAYAYGLFGTTERHVPENVTVTYELELLSFKIHELGRWEIKNAERKKRAIFNKERGIELFKEGKYQEAVRHFRDCSDYSSCVSPEEDREFVRTVRVPGCLNAAVCCIKLEKFKEALGHADDALKMDPDNIKGLVKRAQALIALEKWEDARQTVIKANKLAPTSAAVRKLVDRVKDYFKDEKDTRAQSFKHIFRGSIYPEDEWTPIKSLFTELLFGYLFWELLSMFSAQLWFFPLEYMDLTGWEALVGILFVPGLLMLRQDLWRWSSHRQSFLVAAAVGLAIAVRIKRLVLRVLILAASLLLLLIPWGARLAYMGKWAAVGALFSAVGRVYERSRSPIWTRPWITIVIALFSAVAWFFRYSITENMPALPFSLSCSLSLGSLIFAFQWFVLQPGVLARWFDMSVATVSLACFLGAVAGVTLPRPVWPHWRFVNALAPLVISLLLLLLPNFFFAAVYVYFVTSLWIPTMRITTPRPRGATFLLAMLVWFVHFLASVWTVAYNFVPFGGTIAREQTHVHFLVLSALIGLATLLNSPRPADKPFVAKYLLVFGIILSVMVVPMFWFRFRESSGLPYRAARAARRDSGEIRSMIWAVHFGYDNFGRNSFDQIEETIRINRVNVVGLLESDVARPYTDNWDIVDFLASRLGMYADYGPSTLNNTWGCAVLSVYKIVHSERWMLPSPQGELACIVDATLDVHGKHVHVLVTHFGNYRDHQDRLLQTQEVAAMLGRAPPQQPHIFLGYLTNAPYSEHYNMLTAAGWVDSAPQEMKRWCQYIFYRGLNMTKFRRFDTKDTSDTEAQIAHFEHLKS